MLAVQYSSTKEKEYLRAIFSLICYQSFLVFFIDKKITKEYDRNREREEKMPKKYPENLLIEPKPKTHTFRQPKGVDVAATARAYNMSINALLRAALFEYVGNHRPNRADIDKMFI